MYRSTKTLEYPNKNRNKNEAECNMNWVQDGFHNNCLAQRAIALNAQKLLQALQFFNGAMQTLVEKTIEDTIITVKKFDQSRLEYDSYRNDLEMLQQQPAGSVDLQGKIHLAEQRVTQHKVKYEQLRDDVQVKMQFLEENRQLVVEKQLVLFHNAVAAYFSGNQHALDNSLHEFSIRPKPSFLEQS